MSPHHSIGFCPVCGGGLCGIRICGIELESADGRTGNPGDVALHGLVVCDECDATWLLPDLQTNHLYPDLDDPRCPICEAPLWGQTSRWADWPDIESLGWGFAVDRSLDTAPDEGIA